MSGITYERKSSWKIFSNGKAGYPWGSTLTLYQHVPTGLYRAYGGMFREQTSSFLSQGYPHFPCDFPAVPILSTARTCQQQTPGMHRKPLMVRPSSEGSPKPSSCVVIEVHTERYNDGNVQHETTEICES